MSDFVINSFDGVNPSSGLSSIDDIFKQAAASKNSAGAKQVKESSVENSYVSTEFASQGEDVDSEDKTSELDRNGDGKITQDEIDAYNMANKTPETDKKGELDRNGDGKITQDEIDAYNKTGKAQGTGKQDGTTGANSPDKTGEKPSTDYIIGEPDVDTTESISEEQKMVIQTTIENFLNIHCNYEKLEINSNLLTKDENGNPKQQTIEATDKETGESITIQMNFDSEGRVTYIGMHDAHYDSANQLSFTYNPDGTITVQPDTGFSAPGETVGMSYLVAHPTYIIMQDGTITRQGFDGDKETSIIFP